MVTEELRERLWQMIMDSMGTRTITNVIPGHTAQRMLNGVWVDVEPTVATIPCGTERTKALRAILDANKTDVETVADILGVL